MKKDKKLSKEEYREKDNCVVGENLDKNEKHDHKHSSHEDHKKQVAHDGHEKHKKQMTHEGHEGHEGHSHDDKPFLNLKLTWTINIVYTILAFFYLVVKIINPGGDWDIVLHPGIWIPLGLFILFTNGFKYFKVYPLLFKKKIFSVNLLMAVAAHLMFIYTIGISIYALVEHKSVNYAEVHAMWPTIFLIFTLMDFGHIIEGRLKKSSQSGFDKLKALKQRHVYLKRGKDTISIEADKVKIGDKIVVKPGEVVPLDGVLVSKTATIDSSNITGESSFNNLVAGKYVISGSVNKGDEIIIKVNRLAKDSTITRIIDKIQDSTKKLTNSQRAIDRLVKIIIPIVMLIAVLTFVTWVMITTFTDIDSLPWSNVHGQWNIPLSATFTVLDIAAPCALGMAIPLLTTVSSYLGGTHSIVFNSTQKIDEINEVEIIAFDKTGTITEDRFEIVKVEGSKKYLPIVKALEANLNHPIARSLFEYIKEDGAKVTKIKVIPGKGVEGTWNGKKVFIGKKENHKQKNNSISTHLSLKVGNKEVLEFEIEPKIKKNAIKVIKKLQKMGKRVVMITGDNRTAAKNISDKVGIKEFYSETSPEMKLQVVKKLQEKSKVMYVGDGFNDLVASRESDVSVAFASGDEILNDLTDISLVTNDLASLLRLIKLSEMNAKASKYSIGSVFALSFSLIPFAALLIVSPVIGVIIMMSVDVLVVWNAWLYKRLGTKRLEAIA